MESKSAKSTAQSAPETQSANESTNDLKLLCKHCDKHLANESDVIQEFKEWDLIFGDGLNGIKKNEYDTNCNCERVVHGVETSCDGCGTFLGHWILHTFGLKEDDPRKAGRYIIDGANVYPSMPDI